jgi:lipopolysaccharide/colanic/teichoic acid biosynthesis glycosyltransferase
MNSRQLSAEPLRVRRTRRKRQRDSILDRSPALPGRPIRLLNRALDTFLAITLLCVCAVPMLVIAALIRLTSRGGALYTQERVGLDGAPFTVLKFRTMHLDAEAETGPVWSVRGDPRCTAVGSVLRRYCLDELPQLINVVCGEMSLVGPRPERPYFVQEFAQKLPAYNQRHRVLPGITGWAQINGWRGDSSIEKRLEFDLFYIDHWSVLLNVRILLLTPFRILFDQTAC